MNWSIVGNNEIYIFPKAPAMWLRLGCPGVECTLNHRGMYLMRKMATPSTCCLEVCQRQKPPLLSFETKPHSELTM